MKRETIKSYILNILIIICFIQVGILWNYQNHGVPISFLRSFLAGKTIENPALDEKIAREDFFIPYRMVLSSGWESHWIISSGDKNFGILWEDAKLYLGEVLSSKGHQTYIPKEKWGDFVTKRGYSIEFKTNIENSLLKWFLDFPTSTSNVSHGLQKMMVVPNEYGGSGSVNIYIMDDIGIYKYGINAKKQVQGINMFEKMVTKLEQGKDNRVLDYKVFAELVNNERFNYSISPDVLFVYKSIYKNYNNISFYVPEKISPVNLEKQSNLDELARIVLGNEKDSYDHSIDTNGTVLFKNLDSIYRIYNEGFFEYRYIPGIEGTEKKGISSAFISASRFVKKVVELTNNKPNIYLSSIKEKQDYYVFTFDYLVNDIPITFEQDFKVRGNHSERNAIVMEVSGKRVLGCRWILRNFDELREESDYNMNTIDILGKSKLKLSEVSIKDMYVSYVINENESKNLEPRWVIEDASGKVYAIQMNGKEKRN